MIRKLVPLTIFIVIFLAACSSATPTDKVVVTQNPIETAAPTQPTPYPDPLVVTPPPTQSPYPEPGSPGTGAPVIPPSGYEPQPGDENLKRNEVILDMETSEVIVTATNPSQLKVELQGTMPDPCHRLRVVVTPPDDQNVINLDVYALVEKGVACITKIEPFIASIPLGNYAEGRYSVMINGQRMGEFDMLFEPQTEDDKLTRGEVFMDMALTQLLFADDPAYKVGVALRGELPTPCHQLRIVMKPADSQKRIYLELYSVYDPQTTCIAMTQPFYVIYPFSDLTGGHYSVYVNDELVGEFDA